MKPIIELKNLRYSYPADEGAVRVPALDGVNLSIEEGSFVAVLGHNGSGKSTLAKAMCLVLQPDSGEVLIDGKNYADENITLEEIMQARKSVGMVFQNPENQLVAMIVEEDVAFGCENLGLPSAEIRRRVDEALASVGMTEYATSSVNKLSGGQKQRVAIAGALAMKRRCIIFDESTAMLDPSGRREVMNTIERLNREDGITVVLITHYMNEAVRADRVAVMDHGTIIMDGTPREVFGNPQRMWNAGLDVPQSTELLYSLGKEIGLEMRTDVFTPEECADEIVGAIRKISKD